ncbi:MAG TPA: hypothetical protein VLH18_06240, partial [Candidatus Limnocylindrales bacterium]|nr:hypothetical protein [Candidatus Limnocylindrales bacterium]
NGTYRGQKTLEVELKDLQYCDSAVNGNLQLIDRRNHKNRFSYLQEILKKDSSDTVVFAATRARLEKIKACLHVEPPVYFLTTGSVSSFSDIPERCSKLFLFDLPLHEGLLEPVLRNNDPYQPITVHLLYGLEDQERNSLLIDLSFPSTQLLVVIYSLLVEAAGRGNATVFPGQVKEQLKIKPGKNFWHRCKGIFTEIGLLEGDQLAPDWVAQNDSWQNRLISSPVFCNSQELRKRCMKFQELLLYETPTEIARHLNNLPFL